MVSRPTYWRFSHLSYRLSLEILNHAAGIPVFVPESWIITVAVIEPDGLRACATLDRFFLYVDRPGLVFEHPFASARAHDIFAAFFLCDFIPGRMHDLHIDLEHVWILDHNILARAWGNFGGCLRCVRIRVAVVNDRQSLLGLWFPRLCDDIGELEKQ